MSADLGGFPITIKGFWTEYLPLSPKTARLEAKLKAGDAVGVVIAGEGGSARLCVDWVEYCAVGQVQRSTNREAIHRLARVAPYVANSNDEAARFANMRWNSIKPYYEAWKSGQEMPEYGTPLAAWPGITPGAAEVLLAHGIRTVEELRDLSDGVKAKIALPNIRDLCANAQRFIDSYDSQKVATALEEKDAKIAAMAAQSAEQAAQLEEMRQIVLKMQSEMEAQAAQPPPKRKGKVQVAEAEAA